MERARKIRLKLPKRSCLHCGRKFKPARQKQFYCPISSGRSCRQDSNNARIKEGLRLAPPSATALASRDS